MQIQDGTVLSIQIPEIEEGHYIQDLFKWHS